MQKYEIVAENINPKTQLVLDIGCRDKIFKKYIDLPYLGIDVECSNANNPPEIMADFMEITREWKEYTTSVALDVIEHLPDMSQGFEKILELSDETFIFVPNLYSLDKRIRILLGQVHSDKYKLSGQFTRRGYRHQYFFPLDEFDFFIKDFLKSHPMYKLDGSWTCFNSTRHRVLSKIFFQPVLFSSGKTYKISKNSGDI